VINSGLTTRGT